MKNLTNERKIEIKESVYESFSGWSGKEEDFYNNYDINSWNNTDEYTEEESKYADSILEEIKNIVI